MHLFHQILFSAITASLAFIVPTILSAQNCPPNIDFESGTFTGWNCYTGSVASVNNTNIITFDYNGGPVQNRHTMLSSNSGYAVDQYGGFPVNCPNGSGHSIKLGNNIAGTEAEGVSYDFIIPANANIYNLIYNYAVVFQDPGHLPSEQPRLELEIRNLSTGMLISCSSFSFFAIGSPLPGFEQSSNPGSTTPVWFKRWTAVSINLDGLAGNLIRLFFKTADCTFRRHFGYAYIDVNTECSDKFEGANFCPDDSAVFLTAPYGYQNYTWYNNTFTQVLGNQQILNLVPPPSTGTTLAVVLEPYNGYGCRDTLYTDLTDTLTYQANAGLDKNSCNKKPVQLGVPPRIGFSYLWEPTAGLNFPTISNPIATPDTNTTYILYAQHNGGGCRSTDTVFVKSSILDNTLTMLGKPEWCIGSGDSTVLVVQEADSIQWFKNSAAIPGANGTSYKVTATGTYNAFLFSFAGCTEVTDYQYVNISSVPISISAVNINSQCMANNRFAFTSNSTNSVGEMKYTWILGDGFTAFTKNVTYSYKAPGIYNVVLVVSSNTVCGDSSFLKVEVLPNVKSYFSVDDVCIGKQVFPVNLTEEPGTTAVHYLWDFGNGQTSTLRNPPPQAYPQPGRYMISLKVSTDQCPFPLSIQQRFVNIETPQPGINNPVQYAVANLPQNIIARPIGNEVTWAPSVYLDNPTVYKPVFNGSKDQDYIVTLKTKAGCVTVDTQQVKLSKDIVILVPNTFTPNNDGKNDVLKPFMIGIKELTYFKIYNRWGQQIFQSSNAGQGWDGRLKGMPAETQTVVWMLEAVGLNGKIYRTKGSTVLLH